MLGGVAGRVSALRTTGPGSRDEEGSALGQKALSGEGLSVKSGLPTYHLSPLDMIGRHRFHRCQLSKLGGCTGCRAVRGSETGDAKGDCVGIEAPTRIVSMTGRGAARGTAELNLTYDTATADAPAGKVIWGRVGGGRAVTDDPSESTLLTRCASFLGLFQGANAECG